MQSGSSRYKGKVGVESWQGRLRLHLPRALYGGKNKYLTLGLKDTSENRLAAEQKARMIESDIAFDCFDFTLEKYKPKTHLKTIEPNDKPDLLLKDLWDKYVEFKTPQWSVSTLNNQVAQATRHIYRLPHQSISDAVTIRDYLLSTLSQNAAKRLITQLNACCEWGKKSKLINISPFQGLAEDIKISKSEEELNDINPFTREEREAIIEAFESNRFSRYKNIHSHSAYAPYVKFLFFTGCRPSEAIALTWFDITQDFIYFNKAVVTAGKQKNVLKKGLKTQDKRKFPVNDQLRTILNSIKPENAKSSDLVFGNGKYLNQASFRSVWKRVLYGLGIEWRKPYQTRHTFITLQIATGNSSTQVAKWVGTSTQMIEEHYLGDISHIKPKTI